MVHAVTIYASLSIHDTPLSTSTACGGNRRVLFIDNVILQYYHKRMLIRLILVFAANSVRIGRTYQRPPAEDEPGRKTRSIASKLEALEGT